MKKLEWKATKAMLKSVLQRGIKLYSTDELIGEIALAMMNRCEEMGATDNSKYTQLSLNKLSYEASLMVRDIEFNRPQFEDEDIFNVTTTHDLNHFSFNAGAAEKLATFVLKREIGKIQNFNHPAFKTCNKLESCYRPTHEKLYNKLLAENLAA